MIKVLSMKNFNKAFLLGWLLWLTPFTAFAANPSNVVNFPSVAAITALGSAASFYPKVTTTGYNVGSTIGAGAYSYAPACPGIIDGGAYIAVTSVPAACYVRSMDGQGTSPEMFGAWGSPKTNAACTISASSTSLSCSGYSFDTPDRGLTIACRYAGAPHTGALSDVLIATISTTSLGGATLSVAASSALSGTGLCAWGHDDTAAMNAALAATAWPNTLTLMSSGYLMTGKFKIGNALSTWAHNVAATNTASVIIAQAGHSSDCAEINPATNAGVALGLLYLSVKVSNISFFCMNSGNNGLITLRGEPITLTNVSVYDAWRNCEAFVPTGTSPNIQQYAFTHAGLYRCGLHTVYQFSDDPGISGGNVNEIAHTDTFTSGYGYNGMFLVGQAVTTAANNGSGIVRLTVPSTATYTSGHPVSGINIGGTTEANGVTPGTVVNGATIDLSYAITNVVAGTGGACLLTLSSATPVGLVTGNTYTVAGIGGATGCTGAGPYTITVVPPDPMVAPAQSTKILLTGTTFGGAYTSGGAIGITFTNAYTSGGMVAPSEQLGAVIYTLAAGSGNNNTMLRQHWYGPTEFNADVTGAASAGSLINPNAIMMADGRLPHPERAADASALAAPYQTWNFFSPTIETSGGGGSFVGAVLAAETPALAPVSINGNAISRSGQWTYNTMNVSFGPSCVSTNNGCANHFQYASIFGNTSLEQSGTNIQYGGTISSTTTVTAGTGLAYLNSLKSTQALFTVPATVATDLTAFIGNTHGMVEVSGEDGSSNDFDDYVAWEFFGVSTNSTAVKNTVKGSPGARTYAIDGATGYLQVTIAGAGSYTVRVSPFGGH